MQASRGIFSYASLDLAWTPRVDGAFLVNTPQNLVLGGSVANVPFVTGAGGGGARPSVTARGWEDGARMKRYRSAESMLSRA